MENGCLSIAECADVDGELVHELPREEALVRLYELVERYGTGGRVACPCAASHGLAEHAFGFGCCRRAAAAAA